MSNLDKYQQSNADNDISLAWDEFQKCGEIENNAENVLFAAEYYQTQFKTITKQRDELASTLEMVLAVIDGKTEYHIDEIDIIAIERLLSTIKEQKDEK